MNNTQATNEQDLAQLFQAGLDHHQAGNFDMAEKHYQQLLSIQPHAADLNYLIGNLYFMQGKNKNAIAYLTKAIQYDKNNVDYIAYLGGVCLQDNQIELAVNYLSQALIHNPQLPEVENNLGIALEHQNKTEQAIEHYQTAIKLKNNYAQAYCNLASLLHKQEKLDEAINHYQLAIKYQPDLSVTHDNLGVALRENGDIEAAITAHKKAITLNKTNVNAYVNLGIAYKENLNYALAIDNFNHALQLDKQNKKAHLNLGLLLREQGQLEQAIYYYQNAIKLDPNYAAAHFNLGLALILNKQYQSGWQEFEWRWQTKIMQPSMQSYDAPRWQGEDLTGKILQLTDEQGLGDTIQFLRYLSASEIQKAKKVILRCPALLKNLVENNYPNIECQIPEVDIIGLNDDYYLSLMSVPNYIKNKNPKHSNQLPYLKTADIDNKKWKSYFSKFNNFKVGLCWAGNPDHKNDHNRSLAFEKIRSLLALPNISFFALQKGSARSEAITYFNKNFIDLSEDMHDFYDTACIINQIDLIISVDTAIVHLAGAMHRPVWTLLPKVPDWRWHINTPGSDWYPTMQLFRQKEHGNWQHVIEEIKQCLVEASHENR